MKQAMKCADIQACLHGHI